MLGAIKTIIEGIGEDISREGLKETPQRVLKAYSEIFEGYKPFEEVVSIKDFEDEERSISREKTIEVKGIRFYSMCEHHMLPFFGEVSVKYYPKDRVLGLSKIPRIVQYYSRKLQLQERLGREIAEKIHEITGGEVEVTIKARHLCMEMRGIMSNSETETFYHIREVEDHG